MARRPALIKSKASKKTTRAPRRGVNRFSLMPTDNWDKARYFAHYDIERKDCGTKIKDYIKKNFGKDVFTKINRLPDWKVDMYSHWAATAHLLEVNPDIVPDTYKAGIVKWVEGLAVEGADLKSKKVETEDEDEVKPKRTVNIQEVMREKADEALSDVEALFDEFINAGCPKDFNVDKKVVGALSARNVLPQHMANAIKRYQRLLDEYLELQAGKCDQLKEAYSNYSKMQIRYTIKFIEYVIGEMNGYISLKQAAKKPRAKKAVPVEKVVARIKYRKVDDTLGITSVSPTKLHQCTEAFVYDTAKRKIIWLVADDYSKCLVVKGNSVIGFDKKKSKSKTVRKPNEFLKAFMSASRPATRKAVDDIKAVAAIPNGRFNENMVILKVW